MLKIFLSSTYQYLGQARSEILQQIDSAFAGVGMEEFIPDGTSSHENCINELKKSKIVIFLLSSYYGSLIDTCQLKEECKADCIMKKGEGEGYRISYTHCEYKTTLAEGILHQTYKVLDGWDAQERPEVKQFEEEFGKEMWTRIPDINDPSVVSLICKNLAIKIVEWHTDHKLDFERFVDREEVLNKIIENIDSKIEVWGVGGVGKTALVEVALLVEKLKGRKIVTIGTTKSYKSGSGFKDFRTKCVEDQYITEYPKKITMYDIVKALEKIHLIPKAEDIFSSIQEKLGIRNFLTNFLNERKNLILFIDDFHLATEDVEELIDSLESIILSSRKNSNIAEQEICITGIDEEDREDLINLFNPKIPEKAKTMIKTIAEGHPVATELLVKNYEKIDFDKIKDFELKDANDKQVKDFYNRVIEEIFLNNPQTLDLLKDLAVINTDLPTNINRECVLSTYKTENVRKCFNSLIDTGMLKKKEGKEGIYEFYFKHIQDVLEDVVDQKSHNAALEYYENKGKILAGNHDDIVEELYHKAKSNLNEELIDEFKEINMKIRPVHYGFNRLIEIGIFLKDLVNNEDKATIYDILGGKYRILSRFSESETHYQEALYIRKELAKTNPDVYIADVAWTQDNLGTLYKDLKKFKEAEIAYKEALDIRKKLAKTNPDVYIADVAWTQNSLGTLYLNLKRYEEAEIILKKALEIRKELAEKNPDEYFPKLAWTQDSLGNLYRNLNRFEEAEINLKEALKIRKELAKKNPDAYFPNLSWTQDSLGTFYMDLKKFKEAESAYDEALKIRKELAKKNPDRYIPDVAWTQNSLGSVYMNLGRFEEAETAYNKALEIRKELAEKNHDKYGSDVAWTQGNLGKLYEKISKFDKAEAVYKETLDILTKLAEKNPNAYNPDIAWTQNALGNLYYSLDRLEEAEHAYDKASMLYGELANNNHLVYNPTLARIQYNRACLESLRNNQEKSIRFLNKAIELDKKYIETAKTDGNFDNIRNSQEFKEIVEK